MSKQTLTPFWIIPPSKHGPLGFGVTGFNLEDVLDIISDFGYNLPEDKSMLKIIENIKPEELNNYVATHMGPMIVRGLWYPFIKIGS